MASIRSHLCVHLNYFPLQCKECDHWLPSELIFNFHCQLKGHGPYTEVGGGDLLLGVVGLTQHCLGTTLSRAGEGGEGGRVAGRAAGEQAQGGEHRMGWGVPLPARL